MERGHVLGCTPHFNYLIKSPSWLVDKHELRYLDTEPRGFYRDQRYFSYGLRRRASG